MRRPSTITLILTIFIMLGLQVTILPLIEVGRVRPDLLLVVVSFFSLHWGAGLGLAVGLASGLIKDCFSQGLVGGWAFSLGLLGLVIGCHRKLFYKESPLTQAAVTFLGSIACFFLYHSLSKLYQPMPSLWASFRYVIFPASIYTALSSLPTFLLLQKIFRVTKGPR